MSHSRTGLNAPFYEWIDDVRRAFRKEKELLGKLEYYNVKFIGYKGINYGQIITNPMPSSDKDMLYWLDKIDETERKLKKTRIILNKYKKVKTIICELDIRILDVSIAKISSLENLLIELKISKHIYYNRVNKLTRIIIKTPKNNDEYKVY
jgi:hypothetical protein